MTSRQNTNRFAHLLLFALTYVAGCAATVPVDDAEVASTEEELIRGGGPRGGASFSCSGGLCTCDKSIENDCEDMSGVCTDGTVDALINCINGWLTTHCTCTQAFVAPTPGPYLPPTSGIKQLKQATATTRAAF